MKPPYRQAGFELSDLSTTGYGNDLQVTVEESDGSKRTFTVPFSSVTQMMRPGTSRWEFGAGELNDDSLHDRPNIGYATGITVSTTPLPATRACSTATWIFTPVCLA